MSVFLFMMLGAFVICAMAWAFFRGHKQNGWRSMYRITLGEAAVVFLLVAVVSGLTIGISAYQNRHDVELIAGAVTDKKQARANIGAIAAADIGNPERNLVTDYTTARDA